jgi:serine/threonine-protein kinase RsbT
LDVRLPSSPQRHASSPNGGEIEPDTVEILVRVHCERGLLEARRQSRQLAERATFKPTDRAIITTIVSELARNILLHAGEGQISLRLIQEGNRVGILVSASDAGPGIRDTRRAARDGFSTSGRPGMGLPGVRRLADEFDISSCDSGGTRIVARKWLT